MATTNPITGDAIKSKANSKEYQDNYDLIFRSSRTREDEEHGSEEKPKEQRQQQ